MELTEMAADIELTRPIAHLFEGEDVKYWWEEKIAHTCDESIIDTFNKSHYMDYKKKIVHSDYIKMEDDYYVDFVAYTYEYTAALFEPRLWEKLPADVLLKGLRLGFNDGSCLWWIKHPTKEDRYFTGINKLANALAKLLAWADKEGLVEGSKK